MPPPMRVAPFKLQAKVDISHTATNAQVVINEPASGCVRMGYNKSVKRQVATSLILADLLKKSTTLLRLWLRRCPKQCYLNLTKCSYECIPYKCIPNLSSS